MNHFNMISGEPEESPPNGINSGFGLSEQEVIQNANLMGTFQGGDYYYYDTNSRMMTMGNGSGFSNYMNAPSGNVSGSIGNPAFSVLEAMQNGTFRSPYYQSLPQDQIINIPGFNPGGGDMILPDGIEEIKRKLQLEMMAEQDLAYEKKLEKQREFYRKTGYTANYYGMPYISYDDPSVIAKYREIVEDIRHQAIEVRQSLNRKLSAFAHNYIEGKYDEEKIAELYNEKTIIVPAVQVESDRQEAFFGSMQPVPNNAEMYRQAHAKVSQEHDQYFKKDRDGKVSLDSFLEGASVMRMEDALNEEQQRRRDMSALYSQNGGYRSLIKSSLIERRRREGGDIGSGQMDEDPFTLPTFQAFPTLLESGTMMDDGTVMISPPDSIYTKNMNPQVIINENEEKYQRSKEKFIQAIYQDEPIPGGET